VIARYHEHVRLLLQQRGQRGVELFDRLSLRLEIGVFAVLVRVFEMNEKERLERGIGSLPGSLEEAIKEFEASSLMRETFGEHIFTKLLEAKKAEWDDYRTKVHQWEIDEYLTKY